MNWISQHWTWLAENPLGAFLTGATLIAFTWAASARYFRDRIEFWKEQAESRKPGQAEEPARAAPLRFKYELGGRFGRNLLSSSVHEVTIDEPLSLRVNVPAGSSVRVVLEGLAATYLDDTRSPWIYSLSKIRNWTAEKLNDNNTPRQCFVAESGIADLELRMGRAGNLTISVFEGEHQMATWVKDVRVH